MMAALAVLAETEVSVVVPEVMEDQADPEDTDGIGIEDKNNHPLG